MTELSLYALTTDDKVLIQNTNRLLIALGDTGIARRAAPVGANEREVTAGWRLHDEAAGRHRPFDLILAVAYARSPELIKVQAERLGRVDAFENTWLPQLRTSLKRFVPAPDQPHVEASFWADLKQQPLGPAVIDSVGLFLTRLDELQQSGLPWIADLFTSLAEKGLTAKARTDMAAEVAEARKMAPPAVTPEALAVQVAEANRIQTEALAALRLWFNDLAVSLRRLSYHDRQQLGLLTPGEQG